MQVTLELPWPPSVNHYYRHVGPRVLISRDGRRFRDVVSARIALAGCRKFEGPVSLDLWLYPPDKRRRDIDNVLKSLLDSFTIGGLYDDDSQIKRLRAEMLEPMSNAPYGMVAVTVRNYEKSSSS